MNLKNLFGRKTSAKTEGAKHASTAKLIAHISTSGKVDVVEEWLTQNAKGKWSISTEGMSDDLQVKKYRVVFSEREDYAKFRSRFLQNAPKV
tara:strand:+ start:1211 stop:1486 length:276 start_codon:yes stop_codon:yes gene_type:complete